MIKTILGLGLVGFVGLLLWPESDEEWFENQPPEIQDRIDERLCALNEVQVGSILIEHHAPPVVVVAILEPRMFSVREGVSATSTVYTLNYTKRNAHKIWDIVPPGTKKYSRIANEIGLPMLK